MSVEDRARSIQKLTSLLRAPSSGLLDLRAQDLSGLDLSYVNLEGALLTGASLVGSDLTGARLFGAQLIGADLTDACLAEADLSYAHLQRASLVRVELRDALLGHANLSGAVVRDASLQGALISNLPPELLTPHPKRGWLTLRDGWCCRSYEWRDHLSDEGARRAPIIALHGMTGSGLDFQSLARAVDRPMISVDLYGHGETLWCPVSDELALSEPDWSPPLLSFNEHLTLTERWLRELLSRQLSPDQPFELLGYSMGGRLALSLVERWHRAEDELLRRLSRLTLIGASPGLEGDEEARAERRIQDTRWANRMSSEPLAEVLGDWDAQPVLARLQQVRPELASELRARRVSQPGAGLAYSMRAVSLAEMPPLWGRLSTVETPTLWLTGELDQKFTEIATRASLAQGLQARSLVIQESGHRGGP